MATLKDIAKEAGVSVMTVSNVINGNHKKVSTQTLEKVNELIHKYNYVPSLAARSLVNKSSKLIGVIIPYVNKETSLLHNPYNSEMVGIIEKTLKECDYHLLIRSVENPSDAIRILRNWNIEGAIFLGMFKPQFKKVVEEQKIPVIFMDSYMEDENIITIGIDDYKGGYLSTKHLIDKGHKEIAFASPPFDETIKSVVQQRYEGYMQALKEAKIPVHKDRRFTSEVDYKAAVNVGEFIGSMNSNITAISTTADILAVGIMEGLRRHGKNVPDDYSIVGFDNLAITEYTNPKMSSISQDIEKKATLAVHILVDCVEHKEIPKERITLDVKMVERESVCDIRALSKNEVLVRENIKVQ